MPLLLHEKLAPEGELGLWEIEESEAFFQENLELAPLEKLQLSRMKGRRRLEWLASRYLLHIMSGREVRGSILKDKYGKPHLVDSSYQISLSHSQHLAAVIAAPQAVGIDIQHIVTKISRIAHKYMREEEMKSLQEDSTLDHLHAYWGIKEAVYKAYGRRELDFRKHIRVTPFAYDSNGGFCKATIMKDDFIQKYTLKYHLIQDYMLVYGGI